MLPSPYLKRLASTALALCVRLLHGSLLLSGLMTVTLVAGVYSVKSDKPIDPPTGFREWLVENDATAATEAGPPPALSQRLRSAGDYVTKRYHVAEAGIAPLLQTIEASSREAGLDPLLVVAVIGIESGFNPLSESTMGAQGLMQVIGRFHPEKIDLDTSPDALLDPHANIRVGVRILEQCLRRTGRLNAALQLYAGAPDDSGFGYAKRVIAEKGRIEDAVRRADVQRTAALYPSPKS